MQLHPTRAAVDVAATAIAVVALGVLVTAPAIVAWGGALLVGLAIARAVTLLSVSQIRAAGFEMLWREPSRSRRVARGQILELAAEVRNRDVRAARYVNLRTVSSAELKVRINPPSGEVPAGGRLRVTVTVQTPRVGRHAIHGLSLEVRGSPGLFEIPLTFANPFGIEVFPAAYGTYARSGRGGRSRLATETGRPSPFSGDGPELREIRELVPGDSFKRIAWKASARRGKLLVRDYERQDRDVVWLVLDASVELWAGEPGLAPLDFAIDEVATVAHSHLAGGDQVGLFVCGARPLARIGAGTGPGHAAALFSALVHATATLDADRSDLDDSDLAARIIEHLRPLDPKGAARMSRRNIERLASHVPGMFERAPFRPLDVRGPTTVDRALRQYFTCYGLGSPARTTPDWPGTDEVLAAAFEDIVHARPRASLIYLWAPAADPQTRPRLAKALAERPRRGLSVRWIPMKYEAAIPRDGAVGRAVAEAVALRTRVAERLGERALRRAGVRVEHVHHRVVHHRSAPAADVPSEAR